jgi:hypothetical protein
LISLGQILKALLVSLVLAASAYAVSKLNLFGLESASDRLADNVYQRVTAADYGGDRKGQSAVRVIYLDETSVEAMKGYGWNRFPPTYAQQWSMLDDLMQVGGAPPSAMFVDFVYMGGGGPTDGFDVFVKGVAAATHADAWSNIPACTADPLIRIACIIQAGGTPIVFAKPSPANLDMFTDTQRAIDNVTALAPAIVGQQAYPTITHYGFDAAKAQRLGVHSFDISPAMALYTAYCLRRADGCGIKAFTALRQRAREALDSAPQAAPATPDPIDQSAEKSLGKVFDAPIDVVWGSRPDPAYLALTKAVSGRAATCRGTGTGWRERLGEQLAGLRGPGDGARQECPYTLSLGYDRMVAGTGLQQQDLTTLLAQKLVFVGGQFQASNDWVESPVQGQAPGVHYHAMALDNLIEDGEDYRRNSTDILDSDLLKALLIAALTFCGILVVMTRNSLLDHARHTRAEHKLRPHIYAPLYLGLFGSCILVVGLATWAGVTFLHRSPINWIGIGACTLGFIFYATRQSLPADISGSIEHIGVVRHVLRASRMCASAMKFEEDRLVKPKAQPSSAGSSPDASAPIVSASPPQDPPQET